jgi:prephenate dehydratase
VSHGGQIREALAMKVELALMARPGTRTIARIFSHRAPFDHSRDWLSKSYPEAEQVIVESTSEAASRAAKERDSAAIAGKQVAAQHGLKIVRADVGSEVANQTTFILCRDRWRRLTPVSSSSCRTCRAAWRR